MGGSMYITATSKICHSTDKIFSDSHSWKAIELDVLDHKMLHVRLLDGTVVLYFIAYALWITTWFFLWSYE